jgi:hypothetical protein
MFIRATIDHFSANLGLCLTRGGESCLQTSNPVWTAETLRWLCPIVLIFSVVGILGLFSIKQSFYQFIFTFIILIIIISIGLNSEIKDKNAFLNQNEAPAILKSVPSPNGYGADVLNQSRIQSQLDTARQLACNSANDIQFQWVQLNSQLQQIRMNSIGTIENDRLIQQLQLQLIQLQQQESNLRQQCNG